MRFLIALLFMVGHVSLALGQGADDPRRKEAQEAFQKGVDRFDQGRYEEALTLFTRAYELTGAWQLLYNIGATYRRANFHHEAVVTLRKYLEEGKAAVPADRRAAVDEFMSEIASITGTIRVRSTPPGKVFLDNRFVGDSPLDVVALKGRRLIRIQSDGFQSSERAVDVSVGVVAPMDFELSLIPTKGKVHFDSEPRGALVSIGDRVLGPTPWDEELAPGRYTAGAVRRGYLNASKPFAVAAGEAQSVTFVLMKQVVPPKWYQKPWVWVAVAGGVATVLGGTLLVVDQMNPHYDASYQYP